jgi:hypothetical protein
VPVLLDQTPLPSELAPFQWIDMALMARDSHTWPKDGKEGARGGAGRLPVPRTPSGAAAFIRKAGREIDQMFIAREIRNAMTWLAAQERSSNP